MRIPSWSLIAGLALAAIPAAAQQPQQPAAQATTQAPAQPGTNAGFFSPSIPLVISGFPDRAETPSSPEPTGFSADAAIVAAQAREMLEQDLDRARRESERARDEALRRPAPMIVSPLDGTAPILSPLDRSR